MWRRPSGHRRISTVNPQTPTALTTLNPLTSKNKLNVTRWACLVCEKSVEIGEICGRQLSAQCAKEQAECIYSPTDRTDKHRYHTGCLYQKNTDCTDAHGWVFSRILYSCSAAYRLGFDAPSAQRIATDFFACGELYGRMSHALDMRKICGNRRDLWATTKRTMR